MLLPLDGPSVQGQISVTTSPTEIKVGASAYGERKIVTIQPINGTIRVTFESGKPGFFLFQGGMYSYEASEKQPIYAYTDTGSVDVIISERA